METVGNSSDGLVVAPVAVASTDAGVDTAIDTVEQSAAVGNVPPPGSSMVLGFLGELSDVSGVPGGGELHNVTGIHGGGSTEHK